MRSGFHKTRIAPTPSGYLHLGNILSFIITVGLARKFNASVLLRIDDLDQERVRKEYVQDIFDTLHYLNIPWDEGPRDADEFEQVFSQVHRLELYHKALASLEAAAQVFACDCSRTQVAGNSYQGACLSKKLPVEKKGYNLRLHTSDTNAVQLNDFLSGQLLLNLPATMQHFVVRKKNGFPAYQLASVADDIHYEVDLVVRGEDLWDSSLAQLYLGKLLPLNHFETTVFHHHPLITLNDGRKLSKSAGDISVQSLRKNGKSAADIFTLLAGHLGFDIVVERWEQLFDLYDKSFYDNRLYK